MSLILLDDILFEDTETERKIRMDNCLLFLIFNTSSVICGIIFNIYYTNVPQSSNSHSKPAIFIID